MSAITFKTKLFSIGSKTILLFPKDASAELPSRGQVMVEGTLNSHPIHQPLEPDGNWSHWFEVDPSLGKAGDSVSVSVEPSKVWPEPTLPADLKKALAGHKQANELFVTVTPMARWEWIRWIRSTARQETRQHRIEVAMSKLEHGTRRPCCWNRNLCTEPSVSKNGVLLEPAAASAA
jgi:hypothetical protein